MKTYSCELALSSEPQNWKFHVVVWQTTSKIAPKSVLHLQHDYFSSFNQSHHWFVALLLPLPSSFLALSNISSSEETGSLTKSTSTVNRTFTLDILFPMLCLSETASLNLAAVRGSNIWLSWWNDWKSEGSMLGRFVRYSRECKCHEVSSLTSTYLENHLWREIDPEGHEAPS